MTKTKTAGSDAALNNKGVCGVQWTRSNSLFYYNTKNTYTAAASSRTHARCCGCEGNISTVDHLMTSIKQLHWKSKNRMCERIIDACPS